MARNLNSSLKFFYTHNSDPPPKGFKCVCAKKILGDVLCCSNCKQFYHAACADISADAIVNILKLIDLKVNIKWLCQKCDGFHVKHESLSTISHNISDMSNCIAKLCNILNPVNNNQTVCNSGLNKTIPISPTYAHVTKKVSNLHNFSKIVNTPNIQSQSNNNFFNKKVSNNINFQDENIIVIKNVNNIKCNKFFFVRDEVSNKLNNIKLSSSKLTINNNLFINCFDNESYKILLQSDLKLFGSEYPPMSLTQFNDSSKIFKLFLNGVDKQVTSDLIENSIKEKYSTLLSSDNNALKVIRLKKNDNVLNSLLLITNNYDLSQNLLKKGIVIGHMFYSLKEFCEKDYVKKCSKCLKYGHTSSKCLNKMILCKVCGKADHTTSTCQNSAFCLNCKNNEHMTGSADCPFYQQNILNFSSNFKTNFNKHEF